LEFHTIKETKVKYLASPDAGGGGEQPLVAPSVTAEGSYSKGATYVLWILPLLLKRLPLKIDYDRLSFDILQNIKCQ